MLPPAAWAESPLSPAEALKTFRLADERLQIELVAAEPEVISPVAIAWDEDGRLYVAEMSDYPTGPAGGRIKVLEEPDAHGHYRKASVLAERLPFPNSVLPWKGGVLVTATPNVWFLKRTRGNGPADERRIILSGFNEGNPQLRANGLLWGLDNWVYGANGRSNGSIRKPGDLPNRAVSISRHDFRFQPETGAVEAVAGFSQFGLAVDDWGGRFLSWNTQPFRQVVLEERYLRRNPYLAAAEAVAVIASPSDSGRLYAISPPPNTFNREPVNYFNASCGHTIYRDDLLGRDYRGNLLVCEPLTNLVHRRQLLPAGATFIARPPHPYPLPPKGGEGRVRGAARPPHPYPLPPKGGEGRVRGAARRTETGKEFLASTDPWFHPVNLTTGPDGALYVVDFYRKWVEHPQFVPPNLRDKVDWRTGWDHGRIWRIRPQAAKPRPVPRLGGRASVAEIVKHLDCENGWCRDTAQRLLVERQDRAAVPLLRAVLRQSPRPQARVHALWTLHGLKALDEEALQPVLRDPHARVREHAPRLAEEHLAGSAAVRQAVLALADDADTRVRFRVALALGDLPGKEAAPALARIARRDADDEWTRLAILSGLKDNADRFLDELLRRDPAWVRQPKAGQALLIAQAAAVIGTRNRDAELAAWLLWTAEDGPLSARLAVLAGLADGMARAGRPLRGLLRKPGSSLAMPLQTLDRWLPSVRDVALSEQTPLAHRVSALQALLQAKPDLLGDDLVKLLQPAQPPEVQSAAARGLAEVGDTALASRALAGWGTYAIATRREILASLLRSPTLAVVLVRALEEGQLVPADLDPTTRDILVRFPQADLQRRARKLLPQGQVADRHKIVRKYQSALRLPSESRRGAAVFAKHCLSCHQVQEHGHRVGPDLSGVGSRPAEALLADILDPSRDVAPDYRSYIVTTTRGQVLTGLLAAETATAVKLRRAEGAEDTLLRTEIEELRASGRSLMPEGLEQLLSVQDVADLLAFLRRPVPLPAPGKGGK